MSVMFADTGIGFYVCFVWFGSVLSWTLFSQTPGSVVVVRGRPLVCSIASRCVDVLKQRPLGTNRTVPEVALGVA